MNPYLSHESDSATTGRPSELDPTSIWCDLGTLAQVALKGRAVLFGEETNSGAWKMTQVSAADEAQIGQARAWCAESIAETPTRGLPMQGGGAASVGPVDEAHVIIRAVPAPERPEGRGVLCALASPDRPFEPHETEIVEILARSLERHLRATHLNSVERAIASSDIFVSTTDRRGLLRRASHDLQSPLRTISEFSRLLEQDLGGTDDGRIQESLGFIRMATHTMRRRVLAMLSLFRTCLAPLEATSFPFIEVANAVLHEMRETIDAADGQVTFDELAEMAIVRADRSLLTTALRELLSNAVQFRHADRPAEIQITCKPLPDTRTLAFGVRDRGVGVPDEFVERAFLPLERLHREHGGEGSGLGLSIVRSIARRHGGDAWIQNDLDTNGPGTHARFTLEAPHRPALRKEPEDTSDPPQSR